MDGRIETPIYNATQLAKKLGICRDYISAMKKSGFEFTHGMRTTLQSALDWIAEHPDFRLRTAYPSKAKKKKETVAKSCGAPSPHGVDKSGEPSMTHG